MSKISNKEAALLGLLSEKPKHAYEIENDIKERDMRYWTEISMSSVYKLLNKLEKNHLLESEIQLSEKNVAKKIYSLTKDGLQTLKAKLLQLVSEWQPAIHPVDISLANLKLLNRNKAVEGLNKYAASLDKMIECYKDLEKFLSDNHCGLANIQLATRRIFILKGEKKWLNEFIKDFINEST